MQDLRQVEALGHFISTVDQLESIANYQRSFQDWFHDQNKTSISALQLARRQTHFCDPNHLPNCCSYHIGAVDPRRRGRLVTVTWAKRKRRFSNQQFTDQVRTRQEHDMEDESPN